VLSFEDGCAVRDPLNTMPAANTYAVALRERFQAQLAMAAAAIAEPPAEPVPATEGDEESGFRAPDEEEAPERSIDVMEVFRRNAIDLLRKDATFVARVKSSGIPWKGVQAELLKHFPMDIADRDAQAYNLVPRALNEVLGAGKWGSQKRPKKSGVGETTWIVLK
jgi:hypothetical protein